MPNEKGHREFPVKPKSICGHKDVAWELFKNGYKKIGACHNIDNPASGRVMEKAGMKYVRSCMAQRKFGSDEQCEVRCYEISAE